MIELRQQLDKERSVRMMLEEQVRPRGAGSGCGAVRHRVVCFPGAGSPSSGLCCGRVGAPGDTGTAAAV